MGAENDKDDTRSLYQAPISHPAQSTLAAVGSEVAVPKQGTLHPLLNNSSWKSNRSVSDVSDTRDQLHVQSGITSEPEVAMAVNGESTSTSTSIGDTNNNEQSAKKRRIVSKASKT